LLLLVWQSPVPDPAGKLPCLSRYRAGASVKYHNEIINEVIVRAASRGILTHYCRSSRYCIGYPGLPDLILAGPHAAAWVEVKAGADVLSPEQTTWKHTLLAAGHEVHVIREPDLSDGTLDGLLDRLRGNPGGSDDYDHG
jgi:hypothetical protein